MDTVQDLRQQHENTGISFSRRYRYPEADLLVLIAYRYLAKHVDSYGAEA